MTGSGSNYVVTGTGSAGDTTSDGNMNVNFGSTPVNSISFRWSNTDSAHGAQAIALYDISYDVVAPEIGTGTVVILLFLGMLGLSIFQKSRSRLAF